MTGYDELIEGWLTEPEALLLDKYNVGTWVEIGSWKGKSTCVLAAKSKGIAIDWFKGNIESADIAESTYKDFMKNTKPYRKNITLYNFKFQDARQLIQDPIDLLWLDAEHTYEDTKAAFDMYSPLLKPDGVVIFHDVWGDSYPEVTDFVMTELKDKWENIENADRSAAFRRIK